MYESNTTKLFMFIIVLGQHVSILIESSSGPSKNTDHYLTMLKMSCGIPNAYILDILHMSLCSYYTIRILISKTLTRTYEGGYTMYLRCVVIELCILLYILLLVTKYVYKR